MNRRMILIVALCFLGSQAAQCFGDHHLSLNQRLHQGVDLNVVEVPTGASREEVHALIREKKPEILALFEDNPHLNDKSKSKAVDYIEDFYAVINDPKRYKKEIIDKCRG